MQELGEGALEAGLLHDQQHLLVNLVHLGQTDLVDLVSGEIQGGELVDLALVIGLAVRKTLGGQFNPGPRQIAFPHEDQQLGMGRDHGPGNGVHAFRSKPRLISLGDRGRHGSERGIEAVGFKAR